MPIMLHGTSVLKNPDGTIASGPDCCCGQVWACVEVWEGFWWGECDPPENAHEPSPGTCPDEFNDWDGWDTPAIYSYMCIPLPEGKAIGDWIDCHHSCTLSSDDVCDPPPEEAVCIQRTGYAGKIIATYASDTECNGNCGGD